MANNCWNSFYIYGNSKVIKQVNDWEIALDAIEPSDEDPHRFRAIFEVFYPGVDAQEVNLGSKWVHPDDGEMSFVSAWGPPDGLQDHITLHLAKLDKNVVVKNTYNTEANEMGVRYSTVISPGEVYAQEARVGDEDLIDDDEDDEDEYNKLDRLLIENQLECLATLLDDIPARKRIMKDEMQRLLDILSKRD